MGFKSFARTSAAQGAAKELLKSLPGKDGAIHVAMFNCYGSWGKIMAMGPDEKFNIQANEIIVAMQAEGLEIVDVKFDCDTSQGFSKNSICYHVLVTYR